MALRLYVAPGNEWLTLCDDCAAKRFKKTGYLIDLGTGQAEAVDHCEDCAPCHESVTAGEVEHAATGD